MDKLAHAVQKSRNVDRSRLKILAVGERKQSLCESARTLGRLRGAAVAPSCLFVAVRFAAQVVEGDHDRSE